MNERIKELITQAGGHWNHGDFNMPSSVEFQEQDIEKFAELIVKECLDQCYNRGMNDELYAGQLRAAGYIEKHFGLKQIRKCDVCDCMYPCSALRNEKPWD